MRRRLGWNHAECRCIAGAGRLRSANGGRSPHRLRALRRLMRPDSPCRRASFSVCASLRAGETIDPLNLAQPLESRGRAAARGSGDAQGTHSFPLRLSGKLWAALSLRCAQRKWRSRPISRVLSWTAIPLGASSPIRSSGLPGPDAGRVMRSLFGLAPGGVCRAGLLPGSRCALTAPFHPCLTSEEPSAVSFCCTFRRLAPPRRYLAPCPVEPGLSSACASA